MPGGQGEVPLSRPRHRGSARGDVPCTVPCHLCAVLGCTVPGESNPCAALSAPRRGRITRRVVHASAATTCSTLPASLQEIVLPVGLLDPYVQLPQLPGEVVGLRAQLRHGQRGEHLEFRGQLAPYAGLAPARGRIGRRRHDGMTGAQDVPAGQCVGDRAVRADTRGRVGPVDPPGSGFQARPAPGSPRPAVPWRPPRVPRLPEIARSPRCVPAAAPPCGRHRPAGPAPPYET